MLWPGANVTVITRIQEAFLSGPPPLFMHGVWCLSNKIEDDLDPSCFKKICGRIPSCLNTDKFRITQGPDLTELLFRNLPDATATKAVRASRLGWVVRIIHQEMKAGVEFS